MPRLSVVVPVYNVEDFLEPCLDSIAGQTFGDLEVIVVNDGATDSSPQIAEAYAAKDARFKVVHRPNGGLSAARNTGIEHATGELLAFVDSDDLLLPNAYELLVGSLDETGSDLATGNVLRLFGDRTRKARFLAAAFRETRKRTHVTKFKPLLADRVAWNKVFRRSFWDAHGLTFPEGRINEDIPVMLPLHFSATAVDVISDPIYLWRMRDTGELSITERRAEKRALEMRLWAVTDVHDYLAEHAPSKAKRWYDETLVADDLKYYLNVLDRADDETRELFLDRVNALLDSADDDIYDPLPAIERLKWLLVRRRLLPELLEVLRFQRDELNDRPPLKIGRHYYGDYPFRTDERLAIPLSTYRLGPELTFTARIESIRRDGEDLRISGLAFVDGIGAPVKGFQRVSVSAIRPGPLRRVRLLAAVLRFKTTEVHRPDANADGANRTCDASWSGFEATLPASRLRTLARGQDATWDLYVTARAGGVTRRRVKFHLGDVRRPRAADLPGPPGVLVRAVPTPQRGVQLEVRRHWAAVTGVTDDAGRLRFSGELHDVPEAELRLELRGDDGAARFRVPVQRAGTGWTATVAIDRLLAAVRERGQDDEDDEEITEEDSLDAAFMAGDDDELVPKWELYLSGAPGGPLRLVLPDGADEGAWPAQSLELSLFRTLRGEATLELRPPHGVLRAVRWTGDGRLELEGTAPASAVAQQLVLSSPSTGMVHPYDLGAAATGGAFRVTMTPGAITTLAGTLPLSEGRWQVGISEAGETDPEMVLPLKADAALRAELPVSAMASGKPMVATLTRDDRAVIVVRPDLARDERGPYNQRVLRRNAYAARRTAPLTDTVVYSSFRGRQYSDSPRAIHEELVRRGAPLEHLWIVKDAAAVVPPTARVLRDGSAEAYEAMARSRYVVVNDHFPEWFRRRDDQTCLQTWHGTPLKRLGFDVVRIRGRRFDRQWGEDGDRNWQHVLSPSRFATPILRQAYRLSGEMLETGYPRDDVLAGAEREQRTRQVRERLGIPDGVRTVLYAPTFRDTARDKRGRYRLRTGLDVDRLREALGPDTVILWRKHHYIVDAVPRTPDGFVRDVSTYPDGTELLLAADVLVTDYSSMMVDYANTGRPILLYTYDLDSYADQVRGFYVDFAETVPGPLLRTGDELAEALRDADAVRAAYDDRYRAFVERFCELDDGLASARVVDRLFAEVVSPIAG